ncbi:hypothetical protein [Trichothermofontia sp.]
MSSNLRENLGFVLKVLVASTLISVAIRVWGPEIPIAPTSLNALILVLLPATVFLVLFGWLSLRQHSFRDRGD